jgi:hypothetical protein
MTSFNRICTSVGLTLVLVLVACEAAGIVSIPPDQHNVSIAVYPGDEIRIALGNVGPAIFEDIPQISSTSIRFLGVDVIPPFNPGGPTQQFRFSAQHSGQAVITFRRLLGDSVVSRVVDTVEVR